MEDVRIYTVTQLTKDLRCVLENTFGDVWVEGEISNFIVSSAGHAYFSIKDENSLLNCVMFKSDSARIKFEIENGLHVLCRGRISVYDKRGQYQLYVKKVEPCGLGALQLAFERVKKKLHAEGLFEEEHKKPLPFLPLRIGVVTSPTGAVIKDILKVLRRRYGNIEILLCPVRVQGQEAKDEIAAAIEDLNELNRQIVAGQEQGNVIDVMIVGRGGGSIEDLWPFNEEKVARAIHASEIPVISAVGHEIDYTISDFVADLRAPTPSAAAELAIPLKDELSGRIKDVRGRLFLGMKKKLDILKRELNTLSGSYVLRTPVNVFLQLGQQVDDLTKEATSRVNHYLELKEADLGKITGKLATLSPLSVLERGYSITFSEGRAVKKFTDVKEGSQLVTKLAQGKIASRVERTFRGKG